MPCLADKLNRFRERNGNLVQINLGELHMYNQTMQPATPRVVLPERLRPHFQEYDTDHLDLKRNADLVIQRVLEFGTWEEIRWLFQLYGARRIRLFVRRRGERWLQPVTFNYWRRLLRIRSWTSSPLPTPKGELWNR